MSRQIYGSLCYNIEGRKKSSLISLLFIQFCYIYVEKIPSLYFFFTFHPVSHATVNAAFPPSLGCEFLPLQNCLMCANMIPADSLTGLCLWPLLVLHLRSGLMLLGRVGSRWSEGWSPLTRFKLGSVQTKAVFILFRQLLETL